MMLGPRRCSRPPSEMLSTGSSRVAKPGSTCPTVPRRLSSGLLIATTGGALPLALFAPRIPFNLSRYEVDFFLHLEIEVPVAKVPEQARHAYFSDAVLG